MSKQWIFYVVADAIKDIRHLQDVIFAMVCLRESGVDFNDIKLITNGNMTDFNYFLKNLCNVNMLATPSEILINLLHDSKYQTNFLFVFGHGDINGIKCENNGSHLKAQELLNMFNDKSSNIVFFGQCFSGIFDKVNVKDKNAVFIGATNFCPSLSYLVKYSLRLKNGNQIQLNWMANVFMLFLFESILDAYKYASIKTNEFLQKRRNETFNKFHDESIKLNRLIEELNQLRNQGVNNLFYQQKLQEKYLTEIVFALLNSNDSWILNANKAREIIF